MKSILSIVFLVFSLNFCFSQSNLLNAKTPDQIDNLRPEEKEADFNLEYEDVNPEDILWSKVVYEYIDLNEKLNFPLLYPTNDDDYRESRKSLWKTIFDGIKSGKIKELQIEEGFGENILSAEKGTAKFWDLRKLKTFICVDPLIFFSFCE